MPWSLPPCREPAGRTDKAPGVIPLPLTPGASNSFVFHRDVVINEIMYHAPPLPPVSAGYGSNTLISITNLWKYSALGLDLGNSLEHARLR